jgi:hypothetical protein
MYRTYQLVQDVFQGILPGDSVGFEHCFTHEVDVGVSKNWRYIPKT